MSEYFPYIAGCTASYLLGAIPFGFLIASLKGVDIRKEGSGNIGATNVLRVLGKRLGYLTFALDVLKGFISAFLISLLAGRLFDFEVQNGLKIACGCFAVAGHNWPVFLRFKGGKGVATSAGALLGIAPLGLAAGFAAWLIIFSAFRYVSLASILGAVTAGISSWFIYRNDDSIAIPVTLSLLAVFAALRHRSNIVRLLNGTESKFKRKQK